MNDQALNLPPISRALLTPDELAALFRDLRLVARVEYVGIRMPQARMGTGGATIDDAERTLMSSDATAVQVRYRYQGHNWFDTIKSAPGGFELVRMQQPATPDQP